MNIEAKFVKENSIVRRIWGNSDIVLFIFAGAAAEFALNKAVDWLYFTGKLPADPLGRLFSTVTYAHRIIFATETNSLAAIDAITAIHKGVEQARGMHIPDEAYRDVLYMLIDYSIRSYALLEKKLTQAEKEEVYDVFYRMGSRMGLKDLPVTYNEWLCDRATHIAANLVFNKYTPHLFEQYKKHLGIFRYKIMVGVQAILVPRDVKKMLGFKNIPATNIALFCYKNARSLTFTQMLRARLLPAAYRTQIMELDRQIR